MPELGDVLPLPQKNEAVTDFLGRRRSNLAKIMSAPGPSPEQLDALLKIAARVPDHRKLAPWRFITFLGDAREIFGQHIGAAFAKDHPDAPQDRLTFEAERFLRAPIVIAIISSPVQCPRGTQEWEQVLSSGAVCFNLCLAAQAQGFGAQWLTEWYAYDADVQKALGLGEGEKVAGFIYIGTVSEAPTERVRPDLSTRLQNWPV